MTTFKQIILLVLDGFGVASSSEGNAVTGVVTRNLNYLINNFPATTLQASGPSVGLPWGERGNSEVGHLNLGAGRIVSQDLPRISKAITMGDFFQNTVLMGAMEHVKKNKSKLHLAGLVSNGGVHSSEDHLYALLAMAADNGIKDAFVHMFTDGRDTAPKIAIESLDRLSKKFMQLGLGKVATIVGRFYAMDRGGHWEVTERTYKSMVFGEGEKAAGAREAISAYYEKQIFDETFPPTVITAPDGKPVTTVQEGDAVIFFNFRSDRALQLTKAFSDPNFNKFSKKYPFLQNMYYATLTAYEKDLPVSVAFPPMEIKRGLSEVISEQSWQQFHIAESEKYAHVTSFFNGGREAPFPLEEREIVTSPGSYEQRYSNVPEMSAGKISEKIIEKLNAGVPFVMANFANADMVGHTGVKDACLKAVKAIDDCIGKIAEVALPAGACFIVTADHGNIEEIVDPRSGMIDKEHSMNPVPFIVAGRGLALKQVRSRGYLELASMVPEGVLSDLSPTILDLYGIPKPTEMTAVSLLPFLLKQTTDG
ncbi:MAG: phosphoglycerate mutase (2,3-diphosphoglycerate-independent) [Candidatus Doudnabacteria bacterium RIFCSPHIGHO2_02_FULL_48_21]|uniref:2,3-bisphosphoglycerate-independent phosphoglycerate mutase n=1 Tax=Candidatus Doudnabacteria bacterium RIFCSPLOWO2_02_FULL_48_13 TaxID=1817845 RepID=A0A1F5QDY3_9BACT|nr:MAG: phosphoglycerate mutase (2,3-diphosphoglycerate-independent) [Candidatus Doudnabacteria bacterium RIFCSPHIGHO2_01_48_18]OGE79184.1 MAG: phosphoglycerate mutase (2,3-diphosphoglycerate-independent) [Candidatus Doudnabacteria bacterium RIFCSPHIGHO2_01_FULL_48_180]OGE91816.1 MAG: phosphoglycerate mutase (2,3-diphosphoglycerate-independent) [Candidatus Doudnabacteria bacterium RIFCSPHIGHO2_12_FULL_47_25]OGE93666.1 MAG: phosphoglycerate mutase (2,3-diphosphoglycerate-independent) [Candidatus 